MAEEDDELAQFATAQSAREAFHRAVSGSPLEARHSASIEAATTIPSLATPPRPNYEDPADAPLPEFLELPPLPADPGLDGFVEAAAGEGDNEEGTGVVAVAPPVRCLSSGDAAAAAAGATSAPAASASASPPRHHQPLLPLLLRAATLPWEGASSSSSDRLSSPPEGDGDGGEDKAGASPLPPKQEQEGGQEDLCASLPLRLRHARWLASRVAGASVSTDEINDALSAAIEANGRLLVDLDGAARRAETEAEGKSGGGKDAAAAADAQLLRSLASSLSSSQPRFSGWLRVRLVSFRSASRKQQQQQERLGGRRDKSRGFLSGLFACCAAPPPKLEEWERGDEEGGGVNDGGGGGGGGGGGSDPKRPLSSASPVPRQPPPPPPPPRSRPLRRRPAAVALVWLLEGGEGDKEKSINSSNQQQQQQPPPPPLLRTPPARRGATSVWEEPASAAGGEAGLDDESEDRFVPPTKVSTRFCTPVRGPCSLSSPSSSSSKSSPALVFRLRDALGRGRLAAAVAGGDPLIGSGELSLSEVLARAGGGKKRAAAGPVTLGVPIFREPEGEEGAFSSSSPSSSSAAPSSPPRRELAGVLRVVVDFVCEERLPLPPSSGGEDGKSAGAAAGVPFSSSSSSSFPQTIPAASTKTWTALLALLWRAWEREEDEEGEKAERAEGEIEQRQQQQQQLLPTPPPPPTLADADDLASGVGGLSQGFEPLERAVSSGLVPNGRFLAAARSAAALCRVSAPAQQAAVLSLLLERWDPRGERMSSSSSLASSTAVAELAASLWRPLAAVARGEDGTKNGLRDEVAAVVSLAGGRAAAAAVRSVESFDLLWGDRGGGGASLAAARATLELCALGVTWSQRVEALEDPLAAHVRRAARRMARRAVVAAFERSLSSSLSPSSFSSSNKRPSPASLALAAATAACEAARRGIEIDSMLAPAFRSSPPSSPSRTTSGKVAGKGAGGGEKEGPEPDGVEIGGLDLVAVAGRVRVSSALALLRAALRGEKGDDDDDEQEEAGRGGGSWPPSPPAYGAAAQRLEDSARALSSALGREARRRAQGEGERGEALSSSSRLPPPFDVDELFDPCVSSALWGLRPLALAWVDRTLRPREVVEEADALALLAGGGRRRRRGLGGFFGRSSARPSTTTPPPPPTTTSAASAATLIWRPVSLAAGALYSPAVVDLFSLLASATDGLGARALARPPRAEGAALRHARSLAAALAPAPARMAALTEAALEGEFVASRGAPAFDDGASSDGEPSPWWMLRLGGKGKSAASEGGDRGSKSLPGRGRRVPLSSKPPKRPHPLSNAACVQLSSLFELCTRAKDADKRLRQMLISGGGGVGGECDAKNAAASSSSSSLPPPRLAPNVELAARLSSAASRGAAVVAGRLGERLRFEFARAADEAMVSSSVFSSSSSQRQQTRPGSAAPADSSSRAAELIAAELESLDGKMSREALRGVARALWRVSVAAAESVLLSAVAVVASPSASSPSSSSALSLEEAEAVLSASAIVADTLESLSGPAPLPASALEPLSERLRSLAALARSPTSDVSDAARLLWAAAAARACASSGLGEGGSSRKRRRSSRWWSRTGGGGGGDDDDDDEEEEEEEDCESEEEGNEVETTPPPPPTTTESSSSPMATKNPLLAAASKLPGLAYADAVRLLSSRAAAEGRVGGEGEGEAARAAREAAAHASGKVMTAVFGLRAPEGVVASFECRASCAGGARGTLFLSERYFAFAKAGYGVDIAGAAAVGSSGNTANSGGGGGFGLPFLSPSTSVVASAAAAHDDAASLPFVTASASYPPLTVFKLSRLSRMERCRRQR